MRKIQIEKIEGCVAHTIDESGELKCCLAWELNSHFCELDFLECRKGLAFLTTMEADATLINWFKVLAVGGRLELTTPDSNYYAKMWLEADWDETSLQNEKSDARSAFAGLFGNQITGNPKFDNYSNAYSDVYKSAYNKKRLTFLLERAGFVDVDVRASQGWLKALATKSMEKGERQIATNYEAIRLDHKNRYQFACDQLKPDSSQNILDLACGIGYGSLMLAEATGASVTGVDIDAGAIAYAKKYYRSRNTNFVCEDARKLTLPSDFFDAIVSFETIEHIDFDVELLVKFYQLLKPGGIFICSTPNEDVMPFSKENFKFHVKHYRVAEIKALLEYIGFKIEQSFTQFDPKDGEVVEGEEGSFTIAVARK